MSATYEALTGRYVYAVTRRHYQVGTSMPSPDEALTGRYVSAVTGEVLRGRDVYAITRRDIARKVRMCHQQTRH